LQHLGVFCYGQPRLVLSPLRPIGFIGAVEWLAHSGFSLTVPHNLVLATAALLNLINNSAAVMLLIKVVNLSQPVTAYVLALANSFGGSLFIVVQQEGDLELITDGLESGQTAGS